MKVIPNLKYTDKHEWVKIDGEFAYIGITAYAQNQLGEVLFDELGLTHGKKCHGQNITIF